MDTNPSTTQPCALCRVNFADSELVVRYTSDRDLEICRMCSASLTLARRGMA